MRFSTLTGAVLSAAIPAFGREMPKDEARGAELYDSGIMHETIMSKKIAHWEEEEATGLMDSTKWPRLDYTKCVNGIAAAVPGDPLLTFRCKNVSYLHYKYTFLVLIIADGSLWFY